MEEARLKVSHLSGLFILVGTALVIAIVGAVVERACGHPIAAMCRDDEDEDEEGDQEGEEEGEQCKGAAEASAASPDLATNGTGKMSGNAIRRALPVFEVEIEGTESSAWHSSHPTAMMTGLQLEDSAPRDAPGADGWHCRPGC